MHDQTFNSLGVVLTKPIPPHLQNRPRSQLPRRTEQPLRRNSYDARRPQPGYRNKISRKEARDIVLAAKLYDNAGRKDGKRPLGRAAIQILELLTNLAAYSGRVEPSYNYIMQQCGVARDTITRALKALRAHGFLDWVRRYLPTGRDTGPQVQQTTNAYRLSLPAIAKRLLEAFFRPRNIIPDDIAHQITERARQIDAMRESLTMREQLALEFGAGDPLAESLARLHDSIMQKRESEKQGESGVRV